MVLMYMTIFGSDLLVFRTISVIIYLFFAYAVFSIGQILYGTKKALVPFLLTVSLTGGIAFYNRALVTALMFFAFVVYYLLLFDKDKKRHHLFYSGVMSALCVFFRHDFAAYIIVISIAFFAINYFKTKQFIIKELIVFYSGFILLTGIIYLYVMSASGFDNMYRQLIIAPLTIFKDYRSIDLPIPFMSFSFSAGGIYNLWQSIMYYFPALVLLLLVVKGVFNKTENEIPKMYYFIGIIAFVLMNQGGTRSDFEHILPSIAFSLLLLPLFISNIKRNKILIYSLIIAFIALPSIFAKLAIVNKSFAIGANQYLDVEKAERISIKEDWQKDYKKTIEYIKSNTKKEERIFVCTDRFDKILLNDIMLYVLTDRLPAVKYHELHPGIVTEAIAQNEMKFSLVQNNTQLIVRELNSFQEENNKSAVSSGVNILDEFINDNYELTEQFGNYQIYLLKTHLR